MSVPHLLQSLSLICRFFSEHPDNACIILFQAIVSEGGDIAREGEDVADFEEMERKAQEQREKVWLARLTIGSQEVEVPSTGEARKRLV